MKFRLRHISEKLLDLIPNIIEIGVTSIAAKPEDIAKKIDDKIKKLLEKPKRKNKQQSPSKKQKKRYQEHGQDDDAKLMLVEYYNARFPDKKEEKSKHKFIQRLNDLEKIKHLHREFDLEK